MRYCRLPRFSLPRKAASSSSRWSLRDQNDEMAATFPATQTQGIAPRVLDRASWAWDDRRGDGRVACAAHLVASYSIPPSTPAVHRQHRHRHQALASGTDANRGTSTTLVPLICRPSGRDRPQYRFGAGELKLPPDPSSLDPPRWCA